jgi:hypothetical protein
MNVKVFVFAELGLKYYINSLNIMDQLECRIIKEMLFILMKEEQ